MSLHGAGALAFWAVVVFHLKVSRADVTSPSSIHVFHKDTAQDTHLRGRGLATGNAALRGASAARSAASIMLGTSRLDQDPQAPPGNPSTTLTAPTTTSHPTTATTTGDRANSTASQTTTAAPHHHKTPPPSFPEGFQAVTLGIPGGLTEDPLAGQVKFEAVKLHIIKVSQWWEQATTLFCGFLLIMSLALLWLRRLPRPDAAGWELDALMP